MSRGYIKCDDCGLYFRMDSGVSYISIDIYDGKKSVIGQMTDEAVLDYCGRCIPNHFKL